MTTSQRMFGATLPWKLLACLLFVLAVGGSALSGYVLPLLGTAALVLILLFVAREAARTNARLVAGVLITLAFAMAVMCLMRIQHIPVPMLDAIL